MFVFKQNYISWHYVPFWMGSPSSESFDCSESTAFMLGLGNTAAPSGFL